VNQKCKLEEISLYVIYVVAMISPLISIYAGLSLAVAFILVSIMPLIIAFKNNNLLGALDCVTYKIISILLICCLVSVLWAIDKEKSLKLACILAAMFLFYVALIDFIKNLDEVKKKRICLILTVGFVVAVIAANLEIFTDGMVTKFFRSFEKKEHIFKIVDLNRGSSFLSLIFWPVFAYLLLSRRWIWSVVIFTITFLTIFRLESQSSSLAIFLGSLSLLFVFISGRIGIALIMILTCIIVCSVIFLAQVMDPAKVYQIIPKIPNSASEIRLYIWDFTAGLAAKKPYLGWGLDSSRSINVDASQYVLNNRHPLPIHPHNNILQIWLELGVAGLFMYLALILSIMNDIRRNIQAKENKLAICIAFGLLVTCLSIGQTAYGIWQNWWISAMMLSSCFMYANIKYQNNTLK
jgi:exopolysaccharide production protein ExoQ